MPMIVLGFAVVHTLRVLADAPIDPKRFAKPRVVFFEDFDKPNLDRSRWNVIVTGFNVNVEQQAYIDSEDTLKIVHGREAEGAKHGALLIQGLFRKGFRTKDGQKFDFVSGRIDTRNKAEFKYGRLSSRIKLTAGLGLWPAFWALGNGGWPETGEIDIMENVGPANWTSQALHGPHYFGNTPLVNRTTLQPDVAAWHVYSVDWSPDTLIFKIDAKPVYTVTKAMVEKYGRWAFDNPKHIILNMALGGQYPNQINKADKPYYGIPESTLELIKSGKAKMLVDWVKVEELGS